MIACSYQLICRIVNKKLKAPIGVEIALGHSHGEKCLFFPGETKKNSLYLPYFGGPCNRSSHKNKINSPDYLVCEGCVIGNRGIFG